MLVTLVASLVTLVLLFVLRSVYRFIAPDYIDRDAYAHMIYAREIREAGHRIPLYPSKAVTTGEYRYPFFMHWILSFLPDDTLKVVERYFSGLNDLLFAGVILLLAPLGILSGFQAVIALLIFVSTPEFMRPDQAHCIGMSGRKPGLLLTTLSLLSFVLWFDSGNLFLLVLSVLLGATVFLTSKFSLQAYTFISVAVSVLVSPLAIASVVMAFVVAVAASGGRYYDVFRGHITHLYDYAVNKQFKISYTRPDIGLPDLSEIDSSRDVLEKFYMSQFFRTFSNNLFVIGLAVTYVFVQYTGTPVELPSGFGAWILGGVLSYVLISLPYLRFLGEAERYLEFIFLPSVVLIVKALSVFGVVYQVVIGVLLLLGFLSFPIYVWAFRNVFYDAEDEESISAMMDELREQGKGVVLFQPVWQNRRVAWETPHLVVDTILNDSTPEAVEELNRLFPTNYGIITDDVEWLKERFGPDWVIFDTGKSNDLTETDLEKPDVEPAVKHGSFELYDSDTVLEVQRGTG